MKNTVSVAWEKNMKFNALVNGHNLILDAGESVGGQNQGPRPKALLMVALAGCTGMDVISILNKMKVEIEEFNLKVEGETKDDHPEKFLNMKIIYEFKGKNINIEKVKKAIDLSIDRYCGVYANLKDAMELSHEIVIREVEK
jgi:putative redox protein